MLKIQRFIALLAVIVVMAGVKAVYAEEKLVFAVTLIRHGDRMPCREIPASPYDWQIGIGELTATGMNQEYLLGKRLRARYVDELHLLAPKYENNSIYARSSNINRTIMSAQSLLLGLYPPGLGPLLPDGNPALPGAIQPIPIRTLPEEQDQVLLSKDLNTAKFNEMLDNLVYNAEDWKKINLPYQKSFQRWSETFGVKINDLRDLIPVGDNLNVRLLKDFPLPKGVTRDEAIDIVKVSSRAMAMQYKPKKVSCFLSKYFFQELVSHLQKAVDGKQRFKYIIYAGHDITVLPVMSVLGAPLDGVPPYASNVNFELYKNNDEFFIKVQYNGDYVTLPGASGKNSCKYDQFIKMVTITE